MRTNDKPRLSSFLKWPGGKRWASAVICRVVQRYLSGKYIEPFLGGGSVFFHLRPERAVLADINEEVIDTYKVVRSQPRLVISKLRVLPVNREVYDKIRHESPRKACDRAVRLLYLNRTSFSGMYRLNRSGQFNVPFGGGDRTPAILWEKGLIEDASIALKQSKLLCSDFEPILESATDGDVVYCDPTYTVAHDNNGFRRYNDAVFAWRDQERLARATFRAAGRGATVIISNAHHKSIRDLYSSKPTVMTRVLRRSSCIARQPEHRRIVQEYLFIIRPS